MTEKPQDRIAFDKAASVRSYDKDGHLHVSSANISCANVCGYYGREIPGAAQLGLQADKLYHLYRDPVELAKAAPSFEGKQLLLVHKSQSANDHSHDLTVGAIRDVSFDPPYLKAALTVWPGPAIAGVETGVQQQLSSSYRYRADMTPGIAADGTPYDGVMRDILGNHVALVEKGRAGPECIVGDEHPKEPRMAKRKDAFAALAVSYLAQAETLKPKMAQDAALPPVVAHLERLAADAKKAADETDDKDDDLDLSKDKKAKDDGESDEDKKKREDKDAADKKAKDEEDAKKKDDDKAMDKKAFDAALEAAVMSARTETIAHMQALEAAKREVRPFVGEIVVAMDSAADVYKFALDKRGVDIKDVPPAAFRAMVRMLPLTGAAPSPAVAMDSARAAQSEFDKRFPTASKLVRS